MISFCLLIHEYWTWLPDYYIEEKQEELKVFVAIPRELSEFINEIQKHITSLKADIILKSCVDDLQQYVRRQNVRIFRAPVKKKERPIQTLKIW